MTAYLSAYLSAHLSAALKRLGTRGQNTVEYLMMLAVIVGVILVVGAMFKPRIGEIFNQVANMIMGAIRGVGATQ